ncbi:response regulator [Pseudothauera nasutitermitis]|uniref:Response regulator n=1 Tax=Pseudothauera nasutitermitis TaxID=2565930 RepID=A0A4S4ASY5_9RHOO|nr:sigma 54-interacting transcriptional regulator [Pseudothauera nasutitermitis]THF62279.1 response regulator [Pseudothauera nasutitermitis]
MIDSSVRPSPAHLLLVDGGHEPVAALAATLVAHAYRVDRVTDAGTAHTHLAARHYDLLLSATRLPAGHSGLALFETARARHPALPTILLAQPGSIAEAVDAVSRGVSGYLPAPFEPAALLAQLAQALRWRGDGGTQRDAWRTDIVSRSTHMARLLEEARLVAATEASVLIHGDSGTGKELLARAIHRASARANGPFIAVNCAAIPEQLLESELFGHRRGAFTGAVSDQRGLFRQAHGGTLFLDEIGDMPLPLQVKLLRVLQERAVRPVGAGSAEAVDVRILSATHRDLERALAEGRFREDLYYRLNVVGLHLPSLDERREDIPLLAAHFLAQVAQRYGRPCRAFATDALELLATAAWPGNLRQLQNVVEQACALSTSALIPRALVERALQRSGAVSLNYAEAKQQFERDYLVGLLKLTAGNVSDAARLAGRNRTEFYRLMQRNALSAELFRPAQAGEGSGLAWH